MSGKPNKTWWQSQTRFETQLEIRWGRRRFGAFPDPPCAGMTPSSLRRSGASNQPRAARRHLAPIPPQPVTGPNSVVESRAILGGTGRPSLRLGRDPTSPGRRRPPNLGPPASGRNSGEWRREPPSLPVGEDARPRSPSRPREDLGSCLAALGPDVLGHGETSDVVGRWHDTGCPASGSPGGCDVSTLGNDVVGRRDSCGSGSASRFVRVGATDCRSHTGPRPGSVGFGAVHCHRLELVFYSWNNETRSLLPPVNRLRLPFAAGVCDSCWSTSS